MNRSLLISCLIGAVVLSAPAAFAQDFGGGNPFGFEPEKAKLTLAPGASGELVVVARVPDEHHLYAKSLAGAPVGVEVEAPPAVRVGAVRLPDTASEESFGETKDVFPDGARFVVPVTVAEDASGEQKVTVGISFQGCSATECFMPTTKSVTFAIAVEGEPVANGGGEEPAADEPNDPFGFAAVEKSVTLAPGATGELAFTAKVPEKHHLYEVAPVGPLEVSVEAPTDVNVGEVVRPASVKEKDATQGGKEVEVYPDGARFVVPVGVKPDAKPGDRTVVAKIKYQGCSETACFMPATREVRFTVSVAGDPVAGGTGVPTAGGGGTAGAGGGAADDATATPKPARTGFARWLDGIEADYGLWLVYLACFAIGLGLCFTPCVFPMVAITSAIFGTRGVEAAGKEIKGSPIPSALLYGLGIGSTFGAFGLAAGLLEGTVNTAAAFQNPIVLGLIVTIFVALALSMFGLYDLKPPSWVMERYQSASEKGTLGAFFLMGILGALVAAPCAGPPVIGLSIFVADRGVVVATTLLFACGLGLAAPFMVLGIASGAATAMPRPGPWLVKVKKFFGILLLATALYFAKSLLSEPTYALILGLFQLTVGIFAGALDRYEAGKATTFERVQQTFAVLCLLLGLVNLGGWLLHGTVPEGQVGSVGVPAEAIEFEKDLPAALERAKAEGKPVFVDFTAEWCTYCKTIEREAFPDPRVVAASKRFVNVKVDVTQADEKAAEAWKLVAGPGQPPWLAFFDSSGKLLDSSELGYEGGVIEAAKLAEIMESIK